MRSETKLRIIGQQIAKLESGLSPDTLAAERNIKAKALSVNEMADKAIFAMVIGKRNGSDIVASLNTVLGRKPKNAKRTSAKVKNENRKYKGGMKREIADTMIVAVGEPGSEERINALAEYYAKFPENESPFAFELDFDSVVAALSDRVDKVYSISRTDKRSSDERYDG